MKHSLRSATFIVVALVLVACFALPRGEADELIIPRKQSFYSANRAFRLTVFAGTEPKFGRVLMEERAPKWRFWSRYQAVWTASLTSDDVPLHAVVSEDGRLVATFGTFGRDAIVLRGSLGKAVASFGLLDVLRQDEIDGIPMGVALISWFRSARFTVDGLRPVLEVTLNQRALHDAATQPTIRFDAASGALLRPAEDLAAIKRQQQTCEGFNLNDLSVGNVGSSIAWSVLCVSWRR